MKAAWSCHAPGVCVPGPLGARIRSSQRPCGPEVGSRYVHVCVRVQVCMRVRVCVPGRSRDASYGCDALVCVEQASHTVYAGHHLCSPHPS